MTIIQIGPFPVSPECIHGGVEASVYGLSCEFSRDQNNRVIVFDNPRIGVKTAVEIVETGSSTSLEVRRYQNQGKHNQDSIKLVNHILKEICEIHPDICHIHGTGLFSSTIHKHLQKKGFKTIVTVHGLLHIEKKNVLERHFSAKALYQYIVQTRTEKAMLKRCREIIVDTEYVAEALRHYGISPRKLPDIHVIPQGIDNRFFELKCSRNSNLILSVGSFSRRKGHLYLLQAFDELCNMGIDARLMICGTCAEDGYYRQMLDYASKSPNKDRIKICPDISRGELDKAYESSHIFALHSEEESQGIVFAEAMATGLPVVATNVGGVPCVIKNGYCGLLSTYSDIHSYVNNLETLSQDFSLWESIANNAQKESLSYNWSIISSKIKTLMKTL